MNTLSLFKMPFSEFQLKGTVSMALQQSVKSPEDDYQKSLNRASNFFRIQRDMNSIRLDIESNGWFQNGIHNLINDFKFRYDNPKPVGIWIERVF